MEGGAENEGQDDLLDTLDKGGGSHLLFGFLLRVAGVGLSVLKAEVNVLIVGEGLGADASAGADALVEVCGHEKHLAQSSSETVLGIATEKLRLRYCKGYLLAQPKNA